MSTGFRRQPRALVAADVEHQRRFARRQAEQREPELIVAEGAAAVCVYAACPPTQHSMHHDDRRRRMPKVSSADESYQNARLDRCLSARYTWWLPPSIGLSCDRCGADSHLSKKLSAKMSRWAGSPRVSARTIALCTTSRLRDLELRCNGAWHCRLEGTAFPSSPGDQVCGWPWFSRLTCATPLQPDMDPFCDFAPRQHGPAC